jgi:hypothetical protein
MTKNIASDDTVRLTFNIQFYKTFMRPMAKISHTILVHLILVNLLSEGIYLSHTYKRRPFS